MASRARLFAISCLAMFVFGMVIALLGTLFGLPETRARLAIDLAQQGQLLSVMFTGLLAATIVAGPTQDRFGAKLVLVAAAGAVAVALVLLALARSFSSAAVWAGLLGIGAGWLNLGANALVSEVYPESRGRMLNLTNVFFGVGALFVPLLVSVAFGV
ncbi:MAG TPA: MFS transporter, partial [Vicinamibacterales bacterium]|nr:MFS transporter [Vicinamibacterales bacterium]